jgi:hypothetical protein
MSDDFETDPEETARELRDQAMHEDGFTSMRRWLPTQQEAGAA